AGRRQAAGVHRPGRHQPADPTRPDMDRAGAENRRRNGQIARSNRKEAADPRSPRPVTHLPGPGLRECMPAARWDDDGVNKEQDHSSPLRALMAEATAAPYQWFDSLLDAQRSGNGVVILEGDDGGQISGVSRSPGHVYGERARSAS